MCAKSNSELLSAKDQTASSGAHRDEIRRAVLRLANLMPAPVAARLHRGGWLSRVLRPLLNRALPSSPQWVRVRSGAARGLELMIYPRFEKVLWAGTHELPVQQAVTRLLRPGDCFWDVGAHIGVYSLIASRLVGAGGAVHSFEPQPETRKRLLAGTERNGCSNIHAHEVAISGQRGRAVLHAGTAPMLWSLEEPHGDDALADAATITVECITLADAAEFAGVPTLVKIDVEGAEVEILASCIEWIATVRPSFIVEFHDVAAVDPVVAMFPSYLWERLTEHHWLLRPRDLTA